MICGAGQLRKNARGALSQSDIAFFHILYRYIKYTNRITQSVYLTYRNYEVSLESMFCVFIRVQCERARLSREWVFVYAIAFWL